MEVAKEAEGIGFTTTTPDPAAVPGQFADTETRVYIRVAVGVTEIK
jgi:hypothetical protein